MFRRWWDSLGFYWQVYLVTVVSFGTTIFLVETVIEPLVLASLAKHFRFNERTGECILWAFIILIPTLFMRFVLSHMAARRMNGMALLANRLASGDLSARISLTGKDKDAFTQVADLFNKMADALERLFSHEKRLLADISHELRSPLTRMGVAAALLPMKRNADEFDSTVRMLENELAQMNTLVGILLEQGRERLRDLSDYTLVSISLLATEAVSSFSCIAEKDGKRIDAEIAPDIFVWGHPVRLRIILDNVLSNALFHTSSGGRISVVVEQEGEYVLVAIRDQGPGVPEERLPDIFKAFYRVDPSRARNSGGVGLGLTLARDAAMAMGGGLSARNVYPGLCVTLSLPVMKSAMAIVAQGDKVVKKVVVKAVKKNVQGAPLVAGGWQGARDQRTQDW